MSVGRPHVRPRSPRHAAAALVAVVALAAAVGCAGGEEAAGGTTAPSGAATTAAPADDAVAAYRRAADALCTDHARAVSGINTRLGGRPFDQGAALFDAALTDATSKHALDLAALTPPAALAEAHTDLAARADDYATALADVAARSSAGDEPGWRAANARRDAAGATLLAAAERLGLAACARRLGAGADADARAVVVRVLTGAGGEASCTADITARFVASNVGTAADCPGVLAQLAADGATIDILRTSGVDEVIAGVSVDFATVAGNAPKRLVYELVWDAAGPGWRIDSAYDPGSALPAPSGGDTAG